MPANQKYSLQFKLEIAAEALARRKAGERGATTTLGLMHQLSPDVIRQWLIELTPELEELAPPTQPVEPFPLRGVLWCAWCGTPCHTKISKSGTDGYGCAPGCRRASALPAYAMHQAVGRELATRVPARYRASGLAAARLVLHRVTAGASAAELTLRWRSDPVLDWGVA